MQPHYTQYNTLGFMPSMRSCWTDRAFNENFEVDKKIIILGDKNLEIIKAYKAQVSRTIIDNEVVIRITGQSKQAAQRMIDALEALPKEEIYGDNGLPKKKRTRKAKKQ